MTLQIYKYDQLTEWNIVLQSVSVGVPQWL